MQIIASDKKDEEQLRVELAVKLCSKRKGKERKSIYIVPFIYYVYLKEPRHGSHNFTCKYTMHVFPL